MKKDPKELLNAAKIVQSEVKFILKISNEKKFLTFLDINFTVK